MTIGINEGVNKSRSAGFLQGRSAIVARHRFICWMLLVGYCLSTCYAKPTNEPPPQGAGVYPPSEACGYIDCDLRTHYCDTQVNTCSLCADTCGPLQTQDNAARLEFCRQRCGWSYLFTTTPSPSTTPVADTVPPAVLLCTYDGFRASMVAVITCSTLLGVVLTLVVIVVAVVIAVIVWKLRCRRQSRQVLTQDQNAHNIYSAPAYPADKLAGRQLITSMGPESATEFKTTTSLASFNHVAQPTIDHSSSFQNDPHDDTSLGLLISHSATTSLASTSP